MYGKSRASDSFGVQQNLALCRRAVLSTIVKVEPFPIALSQNKETVSGGLALAGGGGMYRLSLAVNENTVANRHKRYIY